MRANELVRVEELVEELSGGERSRRCRNPPSRAATPSRRTSNAPNTPSGSSESRTCSTKQTATGWPPPDAHRPHRPPAPCDRAGSFVSAGAWRASQQPEPLTEMPSARLISPLITRPGHRYHRPDISSRQQLPGALNTGPAEDTHPSGTPGGAKHHGGHTMRHERNRPIMAQLRAFDASPSFRRPDRRDDRPTMRARSSHNLRSLTCLTSATSPA